MGNGMYHQSGLDRVGGFEAGALHCNSEDVRLGDAQAQGVGPDPPPCSTQLATYVDDPAEN